MLAALAMLLPNVARANTGDYKAIPVDRLPAVALQTIKHTWLAARWPLPR